MWHYLSEMTTTGSREGDHKLYQDNKNRDENNGKELVETLLENEKITLKLDQLKEWDRLKIKNIFLHNNIHNEIWKNLDYPPYYYSPGGKWLHAKLHSFWNKGIKDKKLLFCVIENGNIVLTASGIPTQDRAVAMTMQNIYKKKWEKLKIDGKEKYTLDPKLLESYT